MPIDDGLEFGDTDFGVVIPFYEDTRAWVGRRLRKRRGDNIVLTPKSFWGSVQDAIADALQLAFQIAGAAHSMNTFAYARGVNVDKIIEPLGTKRRPAEKSKATLTVYGTAGANILAGSQVRSAQVQTAFATLALAVIPAAPAAVWVIEVAEGFAPGVTFTLTINALPPYVKVAGALDKAADIRDYFVAQVDAFTQLGARSGGSTSGRAAAALFEDGLGAFNLTFVNTGPPCTFKYTALRVGAEAVAFGPVLGQAVTLRQILTPITGWQGVFNEIDASVGANAELDAPLKARHRNEIQAVGGSNTRAIRARVLRFGGASYCRVVPNPTDVVVDGLKPHSIRVIVEYGTVNDGPLKGQPGTADTVGQAILDAKSAGDNVNGLVETFPLDEEGDPQPMLHDVVEPIYLWVKVFVTPGEKFPTIGEPYDSIRDDIVTFGEALGVGFDVDPFALPINKYLDGTDRGVKGADVYLATTATPLPAPSFPGDYLALGASAIIDDDQRAKFDTTRTTVEPA